MLIFPPLPTPSLILANIYPAQARGVKLATISNRRCLLLQLSPLVLTIASEEKGSSNCEEIIIMFLQLLRGVGLTVSEKEEAPFDKKLRKRAAVRYFLIPVFTVLSVKRNEHHLRGRGSRHSVNQWASSTSKASFRLSSESAGTRV